MVACPESPEFPPAPACVPPPSSFCSSVKKTCIICQPRGWVACSTGTPASARRFPFTSSGRAFWTRQGRTGSPIACRGTAVRGAGLRVRHAGSLGAGVGAVTSRWLLQWLFTQKTFYAITRYTSLGCVFRLVSSELLVVATVLKRASLLLCLLTMGSREWGGYGTPTNSYSFYWFWALPWPSLYHSTLKIFLSCGRYCWGGDMDYAHIGEKGGGRWCVNVCGTYR